MCSSDLVTVRWENLTARQALTALLESRNLQLVETPQTGVARIVRQATAHPTTAEIVQAAAKSCINNLRLIDAAKQQWALENGKPHTATPAAKDIAVFIGRGEGMMPVCPGGGAYTIGRISEDPACSIHGHALAPPASVAPSSSTTADLKARLSAAEKIVAFAERDAVLAAIAADAARAGDIETTRTAVRKIAAFSSRDEAICNSARLLVAAGKRADALELARLVTAFPTRDALIEELAK